MSNEILDSGSDLLATEGSSSGGNILVVQWGDTAYSLSDMAQYDIVVAQMNGKDFYLTELADAQARFTSHYQIGGQEVVSVISYDGTEWTPAVVQRLSQVSVNEASAPAYLEDALVSDSDLVSLVPSDGKLHVQVNTEVSYDPKIQTLDEFAINNATSNYGAYALNTGYDTLEWQNKKSYSYCNAIVYQSMRIAQSQGVITLANYALAGNLSGNAPCFNIGLFGTDGTLLGSTGLIFPESGVLLGNAQMVSAFDDALNLARNTRYVIQVWSCGCQLAGFSRGTTSNYNYDFNLRQNLQSAISSADWMETGSSSFSQAEVIPYISLGAAKIA